MGLSKHEIADIIVRLQKGEIIPDDYKYKLFPVRQKEYELVYGGKMRREDILANEDGVFPVPLQIEKIYTGHRKQWKDGWRNIIAFGDNLQFLKTIYENKDPLIKDKVKGKVNLIYIDPPFGTASDFDNKTGQVAYNDKAKGADFIEFFRRRLVVAKELLADNGSIYVHLDQKKVHYIKLVLDEIFGENLFKNEIIWCYRKWAVGGKQYVRNHDTLLFYTKSSQNIFNIQLVPAGEGTMKRWKGKKHIRTIVDGVEKTIELDEPIENPAPDWWDIAIINANAKERLDYPTQKPELLIERIIRASTNENDLVLDYFGGSGTTAAVAEKLNRKWITCDIGKLAIYTIQKRLLNIESSKSIENPKKQYGHPSKCFLTVNTGHYNLEKVFILKQQEYSDFVMNLFEVEPKKKTISGIQIDGEKKDGFNVIIWQYWKFKDSTVDEDYLQDLHSHIGAKIGKRVYIIAPASYVDFISDYYEIDKVRYYFLKVPYHIIKELHKVQFKKFRQPQSKSNVNDLEDAIGFHFMRQPEVKSELKVKAGDVQITIKKFLSDFSEEETDRDMANFESLAMVLIDKDFDGETFDMDLYYFAQDLLPKKKKKAESDEEEIENVKEELKHANQISLPPISRNECGKKIMIIYVDIYGNEFKEEFGVGK